MYTIYLLQANKLILEKSDTNYKVIGRKKLYHILKLHFVLVDDSDFNFFNYFSAHDSFVYIHSFWCSRWKVVFFSLPFGCIEFVYYVSLMVKFKDGGFLLLLFAFISFAIMCVWLYGQKEKKNFEVKNQVISEFVNDLNVNHMSRIGILYSESL